MHMSCMQLWWSKLEWDNNFDGLHYEPYGFHVFWVVDYSIRLYITRPNLLLFRPNSA